MGDRKDNASCMRDRATRLLAAALVARDDGNDEYAEELTRLATEAIDKGGDLESGTAQVANAPARVEVERCQPAERGPSDDPQRE
jgi:hypothetical protein